jgi:hypothetical protein
VGSDDHQLYAFDLNNANNNRPMSAHAQPRLTSLHPNPRLQVGKRTDTASVNDTTGAIT